MTLLRQTLFVPHSNRSEDLVAQVKFEKVVHHLRILCSRRNCSQLGLRTRRCFVFPLRAILIIIVAFSGFRFNRERLVGELPRRDHENGRGENWRSRFRLYREFGADCTESKIVPGRRWIQPRCGSYKLCQAIIIERNGWSAVSGYCSRISVICQSWAEIGVLSWSRHFSDWIKKTLYRGRVRSTQHPVWDLLSPDNKRQWLVLPNPGYGRHRCSSSVNTHISNWIPYVAANQFLSQLGRQLCIGYYGEEYWDGDGDVAILFF